MLCDGASADCLEASRLGKSGKQPPLPTSRLLDIRRRVDCPLNWQIHEHAGFEPRSGRR
jgi:hypothetical protein